MNPEFKKQWLAELRDTEYPWKQRTGELMGSQDQACCLGVGCDIAVREGIIPPWKHEWGRWRVGAEAGFMPMEVYEWAGLPSGNPMVKWTAPDGMVLDVQLSQLNDGSKFTYAGVVYDIPMHTFAQIADVIEAQL